MPRPRRQPRPPSAPLRELRSAPIGLPPTFLTSGLLLHELHTDHPPMLPLRELCCAPKSVRNPSPARASHFFLDDIVSL